VIDPINLYLDEDTLNRRLIKPLRSRNVDILTPKEVGLIGASDEEQLNYAASVGRVVFTFNRRDFIKLHHEYLSTGQHHAGIIVANQAAIGVIIRCLVNLLNARSAAEMQDWLEFLSNWR
jgi:predicted nuclease of predicted toxin-antitoxin system